MNRLPFFPADFLVVSLALISASFGEAAPAYLLRFDHMPLVNVARILSARFAATVTIADSASAPITGDFSSMDAAHALAEAARQAGLVLVVSGAGDSSRYLIETAARASSGAEGSARAATERRAELLKKRADLLDQTASR